MFCQSVVLKIRVLIANMVVRLRFLVFWPLSCSSYCQFNEFQAKNPVSIPLIIPTPMILNAGHGRKRSCAAPWEGEDFPV